MNATGDRSPAAMAEVNKDRYLILAILLMGVFMTMLDGTMVTIALPTITAYFDVSFAVSQWVITGYLIVMTALLIIFGKVSERMGRIKLYMAGWVVFTLSSLGCGLSGNVEQLVGFRLVQGIGASMVTGVAGATIITVFPVQERGRAMGYLVATMAIGSILGPMLGGLVTDNLGWHYIFLINVPIGIVLLMMAGRYLKVPEFRSDDFRMDWFGAITLVIAVASLILLCNELEIGTEIALSMVAYAATFLIALVVFIAHERRCDRPLLDLTIFTNRMFALPLVSMMMYNIAITAVNTLSPFYFQLVIGLRASQVGLLFLLVPLAMSIAAPVSGKLYDKHHSRYAAGSGSLMVCLGFAVLALAAMVGNLVLAAAALVLWGIGSGFFGAPNTTETIGALPREKAAIASTVYSTAGGLAMALGVSMSSILLTVQFAMSGHHGTVFEAGNALLTSSVGAVIIVASMLCFVSAALSVLRNV